MMFGAIVGDIVGSSYECGSCKGHDVLDLSCSNRFTDDTVLTLAVAKWLIVDKNHSHEGLVGWLQILGNKYINCGFSATFYYWLLSDKMEPYESIGNGSAMRVSPIGLYASSLDEALELAKISAEVTHNSVSGIKGAQAIAACVYLAKIGRPKEFIRGYISGKFGYDLDFTIKGISESYKHSWVCDGKVPQAINAYLDGKDFKDVLSLAISLGGDTDTLAAMACSIAACTYDIPEELIEKCKCILTDDLLDICNEFEKLLAKRKSSINNGTTGFELLNYYSVEDGVIAGEYPYAVNCELGLKKLDVLRSLGVSVIVDLTEENELMPYSDYIFEIEHIRYPVKDRSIPEDKGELLVLFKSIERYKDEGKTIYIHCWGGVGRTGTIVACWYVYNGSTAKAALDKLNIKWKDCPKSKRRIHCPEYKHQENFVFDFHNFIIQHGKE